MSLNSAQSIFNLIRTKATKEYKDEVPALSSKSPIGDVATPILTNPLCFREFSSLLGVLIKDYCEARVWENPLVELITNNAMPLGEFSREIEGNPVAPLKYDPTHPEYVLNYKFNDDKVAYYVRNVKEIFKISIPYTDMQSAFQSYDAFNSYVSQKLAQQQTGMQLSMYNHVFEALYANYQSGVFKTESIPAISKLTKETIESTVEKMLNASEMMTFISSDFNNYGSLEGANGTFKGWSNPEDIIIIADVKYLNAISVRYLAGVFNLSQAEIKKKIYRVDNFNYEYVNDEGSVVEVESPIKMIVCDKRLFRFSKDLDQETSRFNESTLVTNYWKHFWGTYGINPFANALVFVAGDDEEITDIEVTPTSLTLTGNSKTDDIGITITPDTYTIGDIKVVAKFDESSSNNANDDAEDVDKYLKITTSKEGNTATIVCEALAKAASGTTATNLAEYLISAEIDGNLVPVGYVDITAQNWS